MSMKVITPRQLSRGAKDALSNPNQLHKIFRGSLREDFISASQSITKEFDASPDVRTARKAKETKEYSKMLSCILDDKEKEEPRFAQSLFNLSNIEKNTKPKTSSSSSFIMNNSSFFVSDDFSQCFDDDQSEKPRQSQPQPRKKRQTKKLLDDDAEEKEFFDMLDRLSTSESEG